MNTLLTAPDIEYLRGQQMKLDENIIKEHKITHDEWMDEFETKHYLALRVEVHEFINECYDVWKYWKNKPVDRERIIDEAVDVIHFVCLLWNKGSSTATDDAEQLKVSMRAFNIWSTEDKLFYLSENPVKENILGYTLLILDDYGFSSQDILDAYNRKNKINFERLQGNY